MTGAVHPLPTHLHGMCKGNVTLPSLCGRCTYHVSRTCVVSVFSTRNGQERWKSGGSEVRKHNSALYSENLKAMYTTREQIGKYCHIEGG
jgi:hypothetical protein